MKKLALTIVIALAMLPCRSFGQSFSALWKQADEAAGKDLPKAQIEILEKIEAKAEGEKAYGQLLKASLKKAQVEAEVAPDSLRPAVERLERRCAAAADPVLKAVYAAVLCRIYTDNAALSDSSEAVAKRYKRMAMADPKALAAARAGAFEPVVVGGYNGKIFGDDMLSVVGYEVEDFQTLYDHYHAEGNRAATCLAALELVRQHKGEAEVCVNKSEYINWLDSLIHVYSDVSVACEAAIERFRYMGQCPGVTAEQKISYIHYALDKWGGWQNAGQLRNAERELTAPRMQVNMERRVNRPGMPDTIRLSGLRNITMMQMRVYRADVDGDTELNPDNDTDYKRLRPRLTELKDRAVERRYMNHPDYQFFEDSIAIEGLPAGVYMLELSTSPQTGTVRWLYYVTDVYLLSHGLPGNRTRYVAVSATTGQPLPGAKVRVETPAAGGGGPVTTTLTCNSEGEAVHSYVKRAPNRAFAYTDSDRFCPDASAYSTFSYYAGEGDRVQTRVFTDRSIYRPGQTVRASAVVYETTDNLNHMAVGGKRVKALLRDANFKVVSEKKITTDEYGTCAADFTLPASGMNGIFTVMINNSSARIRVEEYKRPTFRVEFPKINKKYEAGDTLEVRAKALTYAGVPVQGARVKYTVERRQSLWWRPFIGMGGSQKVVPGMGVAELMEGEAVTDADGSFTVLMPMTLPSIPKGIRMFYNIVATADVTDVAGETRTGSVSVPIGTRPTAFSCDVDDKELADSLRAVTFKLQNASGEPITADVRFRLDGDGEWLTGKTSTPILLGRPLESGRHSIFAVCEADTLEREFTVFALADTVPCADIRSWFYVSSETFPADGQPVTVQVGSSDSDVHIVYCISSGNRVIESGAADVTNRLVNRKFEYKEDYGNGLLLTYAWVKDGQCYTHSATIRRPLPDKSLKVKWATFRDRLTPGQEEEWRLSILNPDGTPARAQLMATLYDMSLDQIAPHSWSLDPQTWLPLPYAHWSAPHWYGYSSIVEQAWKPFAFRELELNRFDSSVFPRYRDKVFSCVESAVVLSRPMMRAMKTGAANVAADEVMMAKSTAAIAKETAVIGAAAPQADSAGAGSKAGSVAAPEQLRENLNETAFFMPALVTDGEGNVTLKFTLPESLTTWRFMGVAHTKDMSVGSITGEAVAKKDVMILPNVPRFVRTGDKAQINARVFNTTAAPLSGTARMELIDPETEETVLSRTEKFSVGADATANVAFTYNPDGAHQLLICRITATGEGFSDGEQHYLPVLPDRERVTTTAPFVQNGPGVESIRIDTMFHKGSTDRKLTIEYTNNPAWLVVQALPYMAAPSDNNAIDQAAAYYTNALGRYLADSYPRIKSVFGSWRIEQNGQSMASSLAANAELKDIVMSETPWVADADREEEQKQRLADFFDETLMQGRQASALDKLRSLQNADGSWSWWPDMPGNLHMTATVAEMMVRLNHLAGRQGEADAMLAKALGYLEKGIARQVSEMKKAERGGIPQAFPGSTALSYLYLRAIDGRKLSAKAQADADYLVSLLKKGIKGQTIYDKALTAIILAKRGERQKGREYAQSLKEYTVYSDAAGRYYDTPRAGYSWRDYRIPTVVAAIEAITMITPEDSLTADEMRRWLLHEKCAQAWDTPINSVNAIHAFLSGGATLLAPKAASVLAIDGKPISLPAATAGVGYVKAAVADLQGKAFTATKTSGGTSWGALYAQELQEVGKLQAGGAGISIKRELITDSAALRVGSRVKVRITIKADRDMDFVQVADRRAACMEPVEQLTGYRGGAYCSPKDNATYYYFDIMGKGTHVVETEYYIDRAGRYETGTCTVGCAYAPEYRATAPSMTIEVKQ